MKILHVINHLNIGGAEKLLSDLVPAQKTINRDVEFIVAALGKVSDGYCDSITGFAKIYSGNVPVYSLRSLIFIFKLIFKERPDLVHVHLFPSQLYVALICFFLRVKFILTEHSTENGRRNKWYLQFQERFVYRSAEAIVAISSGTAKCLEKHLKFVPKNLVIIPNGVVVDPVGGQKYKCDFGFKNRIILLTVGRLVQQKGFDYLLDIVPFIKADVSLVLVGDGPERDFLERKAKSNGISSRVLFLGTRTDVRDLMNCADYYIQPSYSEGFGIAAVEAMLANLPIFHSGCVGLAEVVGNAGKCIDMENPAKAAQLINRVIGDVETTAVMKKLGRERSANYSIEKTAAAYLDLYKKIVINE